MNILLVDTDSTIPNLALMKIAGYHKAQGDIVGWNIQDADKAYISCIFKKNAYKAYSAAVLISTQCPNVIIDIGGPGVDLKKELPAEIESSPPDYSIYPDCDYSIGFTTRGCIRHCSFCIVPKKEGKLKRVADIETVHAPIHKSIKLLDNNVLADFDNFKRICKYCIEHKLRIDFSQGLDARLLNDDMARLLSQVKPMHCFNFAFDSLDYTEDVLRTIDLLKKHGINTRSKVMFYVYTTKDMDGPTGVKSALKRCDILRTHDASPYIMCNIDAPTTQIMRDLKRWANRKHLFYSCSFNQYLAPRYVSLTW